jgi:hypothetical protein
MPSNTGGPSSDFEWHWSPRVSTPGAFITNAGPSLPFIADGGTDMQVNGEWAATYGFTSPGVGEIDVWRITTGDTWRLPNRPGHHWKRILAVSATELVLADVLATQDDNSNLHHLVRLDIASLPALVAAWSQ